MEWLESSESLQAQYNAFCRTDPRLLHKELCGCGHDLNALAKHLAVHPLVIARFIKEQGRREAAADKLLPRDGACKGLLDSPRCLSRQVSSTSDLASEESSQSEDGAESEQARWPRHEESLEKRPVRVGLLQFPVRSTSADLSPKAAEDPLVASSCVKISCA